MQGEAKKPSSARKVFKVYWKYTAEYPWLFLVVILTSLVIQGGMLAAPLFLRTFFNLLATHSPDSATLAQMTTLLMLVGVMYLLEWVGRRIQTWANTVTQSQVMANLMSNAFGYLIHHSHDFFVSRFAGSLVHRVNKFSRAYESLFDTVVFSFFPTLLFVSGAIIILGFRHPVLGLILAAWVVLFILFQFYVSILRQPLRVTRSNADTKITATLSDAISNHNTIALFSPALY